MTMPSAEFANSPLLPYLEKGETLLWQHDQYWWRNAPARLNPKLVGWGGLLLTLILLVIGLILIQAGQGSLVLLTVAIVFLIGLQLGFGSLLRLGGDALHRRSPLTRRWYAITNRRMLCLTKKDLIEQRLPDLTTPAIFENQNGRGTLDFGMSFPKLTNIPNVRDVQRLITEQQKLPHRRQ